MLRVGAVIFALEAATMLALARLDGVLSPVAEIFLDAAVLAVVGAPILHFWLIAPFLRSEREAKMFATRALQTSKEKAAEAQLLAELNDWLQSCKSLDEVSEMVAGFLGKMLPGCSGALYIYANSRDVLDNAIAWNGNGSVATMQPDQCWGLRRGRTYTHGEHAIDFHCRHLGERRPEHYACIPILAHGDTVGLLHLEFPTGDGLTATSEAIVEQRRLAISCAERISLAIANVRLGEQLKDQSIRDPLTDLFNRRYMLETCRREFARAERERASVSILSIDIDHFKQFNDNFGHDAGDTVLRAVAACLKRHFRVEDVPCRFGGEEFVVLLPGAGTAVAAERAEALRAAIQGLSVRYLDDHLPRITISVGVAAFPVQGSTPQAVLRAADQALYEAKAEGRNRVKIAAGRAANRVGSGEPAAHAPTGVNGVNGAAALAS
jgi:diguanylate cyclase (GGDEF)-like protein